MHEAILVTGSPGSPYTRKLLAALRYRQIPYRLRLVGVDGDPSLPVPRIRLLPTVYFEGPDGLTPMVDTTPILRRLDAERPERRIMPDDPAAAFIDALIEDYADEWLTKVMFHYRWSHEADVRKSAGVLPNWFGPSLGDDALRRYGETFAGRQIERLSYVGSSALTALAIERSFERLAAWFDTFLIDHPFLLGGAPATADFAFYGQLSQLALFDPTPRALVEDRHPRVVAWVMAMEDLSGLHVSRWTPAEILGANLRGLLGEIGRTYVPLLLANADALARGLPQVVLEIDGTEWRQAPFPYQRKCLTELRQRFEAAEPADQARIVTALAGTGCEALLGTSHR